MDFHKLNMLYNFMHTKFKNRQSESMWLEVRTHCGGKGRWLEGAWVCAFGVTTNLTFLARQFSLLLRSSAQVCHDAMYLPVSPILGQWFVRCLHLSSGSKKNWFFSLVSFLLVVRTEWWLLNPLHVEPKTRVHLEAFYKRLFVFFIYSQDPI